MDRCQALRALKELEETNPDKIKCVQGENRDCKGCEVRGDCVEYIPVKRKYP
jgi:hypothetical protein